MVGQDGDLFYCTDKPVEQLRFSADRIFNNTEFCDKWLEFKCIICAELGEARLYELYKWALEFIPIHVPANFSGHKNVNQFNCNVQLLEQSLNRDLIDYAPLNFSANKGVKQVYCSTQKVEQILELSSADYVYLMSSDIVEFFYNLDRDFSHMDSSQRNQFLAREKLGMGVYKYFLSFIKDRVANNSFVHKLVYDNHHCSAVGKFKSVDIELDEIEITKNNANFLLNKLQKNKPYGGQFSIFNFKNSKKLT